MSKVAEIQAEVLKLFTGEESQLDNEIQQELLIYKSLVHNALSDYLLKIFPLTFKMLEALGHKVDDLVLNYIEKYPSKSAVYWQAARSFPNFVEELCCNQNIPIENSHIQGLRNEEEGSWVSPNDLTTNEHFRQEWAWLVELNTYELTEVEVYNLEDVDEFTRVVNPYNKVLSFKYNISSLTKVIADCDDAQVLKALKAKAQAETIVVFRTLASFDPSFKVKFLNLAPLSFLVFDFLQQGVQPEDLVATLQANLPQLAAMDEASIQQQLDGLLNNFNEAGLLSNE